MLIPVARTVLPILPDALAFALTRTLASIPFRAPIRAEHRGALESGQPFRFGRTVRKFAWTWGEGLPVVLVHGWGGRAAQMTTMAGAVAGLGFRAVVFDVRGHGDSPGRRIAFDHFIDDLAELDDELDGSVYAYIGHSAGGLCMMAARRLRGLAAQRYVCLCAPRGPYIPINEIRWRLKPRESVIERCRQFYAEQFESDWHRLDTAEAFAWDAQLDRDSRLLLIADNSDSRVDPADVERICRVWPSAERFGTGGLGHSGPLWDAETIERVGDFLGQG